MTLPMPFAQRVPVRPWAAVGTGSRWVRRAAGLAVLIGLGLFVARAPLTWGFALLGGGIGAVLLVRRPSLALYALAFSVPFGSLWDLDLGGLRVGPSELLVLALVTTWLLRMAAFRHVRVARARLTLAVLAYLATMILALWPAQSLSAAFKDLAKWGEFALVYLFVASEPGEADLRWLAAALLLAGTLQGLLGIYQFLYQVGPPAFVLLGRYMRASGTFAQPNPYGGYLGLLLPLGYGVVLTCWREGLGLGRTFRWGMAALWLLALVATAVMSVGLVMSWSRGALLGLAAGAWLVGLALTRRIGFVLSILALVLGVLLSGALPVLSGGLLGRLTEVTQYVGQDLTRIEVTDANFAVMERVAHWVAAWRMFDRQPWLGVGTGQYAVVYPQVSLPRWTDPLGHAHNYFLNVMAEGGLVGLVGYLILILAALASAWRAAGRERGWRRAVALGALGMLGHLIVHSAFDNLYVHGMYLLVAALLGMLVSRPLSYKSLVHG